MSKLNKLNKTENFINKVIIIHGDIYDYSEVEYINSNTKVKIICKIHGIYEQRPRCHLVGQGCSTCANIKRSQNQIKTIDNFIQMAISIHGNKYDYSKINYTDRITKIDIICKIHGLFTQSPNGHLNGQGCKKCTKTGNYDTNEFINKAYKMHGNLYDYSKVNYINSRFKVIIICKIHGKILQNSNTHLQGSGCNFCGRINTTSKLESNTNLFIEKAKIIHKNKYDYSKVDYNKSSKKVVIICNIHGEFLQTAGTHLSGVGCIYCGLITIGNNKRITYDEFYKRAIKIHGNLYDYSKFSYNHCNEKIIIICKKHGKFKTRMS